MVVYGTGGSVSDLGLDWFPLLDVPSLPFLRQAGQAWQRLSEAQKHPYQVKQQEEQVEYEKKMAVYRANLPSGQMMAAQAAGNGNMHHDEEEEEEDEEEYSDEEA